MHFGTRISLLRLLSLAAIVASAILTADALRPGRAFCPLEAACDAARNSALGSVLGIPTSMIGIAAFLAFFAVTYLPVEWARRPLIATGAVAWTAGCGLLAYQLFVLRVLCPLCLVADAAGIAAGAIAVSWPPVFVRLSGRRLPTEPWRSRAGWATVATAAVIVPLLWPRSEAPGWVEIAAVPPDAMHALTPVGEPTRGSTAPAPATANPSAAAVDPRVVSRPAARDAASDVPSPGPTHDAAVAAAPADGADADALAHADRALAISEETPGAYGAVPDTAESGEDASPEDGPLVASRMPESEPPPEPIVIVEYLNAYCTHCRATHERLERVLAALATPVRRYRVYTWASNDYPLWARACVYAGASGLEDRMFAELLRTRTPQPAEVYAAAHRAGVDVAGLEAWLHDPRPPERLVRDRHAAQAARLPGLPTLDIGRRRLMGEQTEVELKDAVRAAGAALRDAP